MICEIELIMIPIDIIDSDIIHGVFVSPCVPNLDNGNSSNDKSIFVIPYTNIKQKMIKDIMV